MVCSDEFISLSIFEVVKHCMQYERRICFHSVFDLSARGVFTGAQAGKQMLGTSVETWKLHNSFEKS
jgi:hypothetical protein